MITPTVTGSHRPMIVGVARESLLELEGGQWAKDDCPTRPCGAAL
jgi:hypothetical protein